MEKWNRWLPGMLGSVLLAGCADSSDQASAPDAVDAAPAKQAMETTMEAVATAPSMVPADWVNVPEPGAEMPVRIIPNVPETAEAYYAPDSLHVIAQTQDPDAVPPSSARAAGGALTYTFTDTGEQITRINDHGQDACSYFFPDMKRLVWTSTRDNPDMPVGNWSDETEYPQGAELYTSDLDGGNVVRLTDNEYYEAEVSISPNGEWIVFGRQIDGKMDLWRMRPDGSEEAQITFTDDWQEGAPFFLPDNRTILTRAWRRSEHDKSPTPMTVFTVTYDGAKRVQRTFDTDMNWAPYPTPDGRHYVFVRIVPPNNWEVFLGDLAGGEPVRLTYNDSFDGFPSVSPDGTKMLFTRSQGGFMSNLYTHVMDISSLNVGPENYADDHPWL
jgi:Tol biopolymer transport system component